MKKLLGNGLKLIGLMCGANVVADVYAKSESVGLTMAITLLGLLGTNEAINHQGTIKKIFGKVKNVFKPRPKPQTTEELLRQLLKEQTEKLIKQDREVNKQVEELKQEVKELRTEVTELKNKKQTETISDDKPLRKELQELEERVNIKTRNAYARGKERADKLIKETLENLTPTTKYQTVTTIPVKQTPKKQTETTIEVKQEKKFKELATAHNESKIHVSVSNVSSKKDWQENTSKKLPNVFSIGYKEEDKEEVKKLIKASKSMSFVDDHTIKVSSPSHNSYKVNIARMKGKFHIVDVIVPSVVVATPKKQTKPVPPIEEVKKQTETIIPKKQTETIIPSVTPSQDKKMDDIVNKYIDKTVPTITEEEQGMLDKIKEVKDFNDMKLDKFKLMIKLGTVPTDKYVIDNLNQDKFEMLIDKGCIRIEPRYLDPDFEKTCEELTDMYKYQTLHEWLKEEIMYDEEDGISHRIISKKNELLHKYAIEYTKAVSKQI